MGATFSIDKANAFSASNVHALRLQLFQRLRTSGSTGVERERIRRPTVGVLDCSLPDGFTLLKWFPLRGTSDLIFSHCKTRHSRAECFNYREFKGGRGCACRWPPIKKVLVLLKPGCESSKFSQGLFLCSPQEVTPS